MQFQNTANYAKCAVVRAFPIKPLLSLYGQEVFLLECELR